MSQPSWIGYELNDRYKIEELLGHGGMSAVFKASDPNLKRIVAAKLIHPHLSKDPEFVRRFEAEAAAVAQLRHPSIIQVYDFNNDGDTYYMVLEFVPGETLQSRLQRLNNANRKLSLEEIVKFSSQIANAAEYAHKRGLIHRDIKPANVMLNIQGDAILMDFGIVKIIGGTQHTATGAVVGTALYMAPEQIRGERPDHRADIYSLGVMMFEMAGGRPPFTADSAMTIMMMHLNDPIPDVAGLNPDVPDGLKRIIERALSKDPVDRYQSAGEMETDLKNLLTSPPSPATKPMPVEPAVTVTEPIGDETVREMTPEIPPIEPQPEKLPQRATPAKEAPIQTTKQAEQSTPMQKTPAPSGFGLSRNVIIGGAIALIAIIIVGGGSLIISQLRGGGGNNQPTASSTFAAVAANTATVPVSTEPAQSAETPLPVAGDTFECTDPIGCIEIAPDEPIHIAYMLTFSGATSNLGEDSLGGIQIAIDDREGMLLGHEISLTGEDSACSAEGGQTAATKIATDPTILGVIGANCSSASTAALDTISNAGLLMISPSTTAPALTDPNGTWKPGFFRTAHNDSFQGRIAAEFAYNMLEASSAATLHDGSPYADQLQQVFTARFRELGGTVISQGAVNVGDTDMRSVLTSMAVYTPDVIYFPIFEPEGPFVVAQSSEINGLEETILMGADGLLVDSFPENAGAQAEGMFLSGPFVNGPAYDEFLQKWNEKFGGTPPAGFHAFAYDATNLLLNAIEAAAMMDNDGMIYIGRQDLRDALAGTTGFQGLSGTLTCSEFGDCASGEALAIYQITAEEINNGKWPADVVWSPVQGLVRELASPPTATPTGPFVTITDITLGDNGEYLVFYETFGYEPVLPGMHIHFFWNSFAPETVGNVGTGDSVGGGSWFLWDEPNPFNGYNVNQRPNDATQICALVANPDHSIFLDTGNCVDLPDS
jgi:branched-chain amino acid transport system substrate-binding protein